MTKRKQSKLQHPILRAHGSFADDNLPLAAQYLEQRTGRFFLKVKWQDPCLADTVYSSCEVKKQCPELLCDLYERILTVQKVNPMSAALPNGASEGLGLPCGKYNAKHVFVNNTLFSYSFKVESDCVQYQLQNPEEPLSPQKPSLPTPLRV